MGLFGPSKGTAESAVKFMNQFLSEVGLNPTECLVRDDQDISGWSLGRGSAPLLVIVFKNPDFPYIKVLSPIVKMPEQDQVAPLLHYCMVKNNNFLVTIALDAESSEIVVKSERPIEGLDKEELEGMMNSVSAAADELDNELAEKFGCEMIGKDLS
tara:strand:+ start:51 stop:518 length:468 start_codon:yes stop_codon:yes gene_type:complete